MAGLVDLSGREVRIETIRIMTDAIKHRGPDGEGQWVYENVGIGHRRLSIIDLSNAASQPMFSDDGHFVLSYNGELYNYKEIRTELESLGVNFRSQSDTEVLLKSLIHWREKALIKFNGMFAFAFYDKKKGEILLARDRYGIKPLYYSLQDGYFLFGSEQKAIKAKTNFRSKLDKEALVEYLTFQNLFTDKTMEEDIKLLPAGHYMFVDTKRTQTLLPIQYWDFDFSEPGILKSEAEYIEELSRLFQQAVKRALVSDVEIGAYLSGGIDSSSIVTVASREISNLKTFTIGFDLTSASASELRFDERSSAKATSALLATNHHELILKASHMEKSINELVWHLEEPRVGQSYPNLYAAKLARERVKVVLSGAGGDELFGGYPWRYFVADKSSRMDEYINEYYLYWQRLMTKQELESLLVPIWKEVSNVSTRDIFKSVFAKNEKVLTKPEDFVSASMYFEAKTFLHGLLIMEDKLSMSVGLETRIPFLDNDLVEFAMKLPVRMKVRNTKNSFIVDENTSGDKKGKFYDNTKDGKYLLRKHAKQLLPGNFAQADKQGFSSPDSSWFRGESKHFVEEIILNCNNPLLDYLSLDKIKILLEEHFSGSKNRRLLIWSLLYLSESLKH